MKFKFIVLGFHPFLEKINRKCLSLDEAENVKNGLQAIGYEVYIETIHNRSNLRRNLSVELTVLLQDIFIRVWK